MFPFMCDSTFVEKGSERWHWNVLRFHDLVEFVSRQEQLSSLNVGVNTEDDEVAARLFDFVLSNRPNHVFET